MNFASTFLEGAASVALAAMAVAFLIAAMRVIAGPTLGDRVVALDMTVASAIGFIAAFGLRSGFYLYVDVAIALGLVGFVATAAFARFILRRAAADAAEEAARPARPGAERAPAASSASDTPMSGSSAEPGSLP